MTRHRLPVGLAAATLLAGLAAAPAIAEVASPTAAELTYKEYHEGVYAAVECRDAVFSPDDYQILESRILERAGGKVFVGRQLELIEAAKDDINLAMSHAGCDADEVEAALVRFDTLRGMQTGQAPATTRQ